MDTTETYIKMCEKAVEIQKLIPYKNCDFYFHAKDGNIITIGEENRDYTVVIDISDGSRFALDDPIIWLPRQDQLQEILGVKLPANALFAISEWVKKNEWLEFQRTHGGLLASSCPFSSMEQLWLAFVMKEKFQKRWDGEEWVGD